MVVCPVDADWYAIPVVGGAELDVTVSFTRLRDDSGHAAPTETISPTAVRIALIDIDGTTPLAVDQGLDDAPPGTTVDASRVERTLEDVMISATVEADGIAYLKVEADSPLEYEYQVEITLTPPCWALEDGYESNDRREHATELADDGPYDARICVTNDDWYGRTVEPGDALFVDVMPPEKDDGTPGIVDARWLVGEGNAPQQEDRISEAGVSYEVRYPDTSVRADLAISSVEETEGNYRISSYYYPPCPNGNDRYETNDQQQLAHQINPQEDPPPYRHLRLCEMDQDWFAMPLAPVEEEEREDQPYRPFSALVEIDGPPVDLQVAVYDADSGRAVAVSQPVEMAPPESFVEGEEAPKSGYVAYAQLPWETQGVVVVVLGAEPTFYHLSFPHTEEQQQQQSGGGEEEQQDEQQDGEDSESEESQADQQEQEEEQEAQQDEQSEEEADQEEEQAQEMTDEEQERELLMQLLDSLEPEDVNLPLQQALEAAPAVRMQNEW